MVSAILILLAAWHGACDSLVSVTGVLLYSSSATYGSRPSQSAFFKMRFRVCTARSLCPFDSGKLGFDVVSAKVCEFLACEWHVVRIL